MKTGDGEESIEQNYAKKQKIDTETDPLGKWFSDLKPSKNSKVIRTNKINAYWDNDQKYFVVNNPRGKILNSFGVPIKGGGLFLFPEEAWYLHEKLHIEVYLDSEWKHPFSPKEFLQFLFTNVSSTHLPMIECMIVYKYLVSQQMIVRRRKKQNDMTSFVCPQIFTSNPLLEEMIPYDVYVPSHTFRKTNPGIPFYSVIVCRYADEFPSKVIWSNLLQMTQSSPIKVFVVDSDHSILIYDIAQDITLQLTSIDKNSNNTSENAS